MILAKWFRLSVVLAAGAAVCTLTPTSAEAAAAPATMPATIQCSPYGIYHEGSRVGGEIICGNTTSEYRVVVQCTDEQRGSSSNFFGPYVTSGNVSSKTCPYEGGEWWIATIIGYQVK